jgi:hypothetical protein
VKGFVTASYIDAQIAEYEGHPLINALPPINSAQQTAQLVRRIPEIKAEEVALPAHIRRHAMLRIMDGFLYPTKAHLQLEQTISSMIRQGYLSRNISDKSYQVTLNKVSQMSASDNRNAGNEALVSSVIGCSGAGKSTAVEAILASYPQVIMHPRYQHFQLVWLKVECPHDASVRSLCINFFRALDNALGNDGEYERQYVRPRSNVEMLLGDFARIAALHSIGLLVIDEIQHLERSNSGASERILRFFVQLTNTIKLPILFIGTPKAYELFSPSMRSARRASQFGSINWNRFNASMDSGKGTEWDRFFAQLWSLQWFKHPQPLTEEVKALFWDCSQGIAHVAVTLFYLSQVRAVTIGREVIDSALVKDVFNSELHIIRPMIRALQSGREQEIQKYSDLEIPKAALIQNQVTTQPIEHEASSITNVDASPNRLVQLVNMLEQVGIGSDIAPLVAEQAIDELPNGNLIDLIAHVRQLEDEAPPKPKPKQKKPKVVKLTPRYVDNDLRLMIQKNKGSYEVMKKAGVVLQISDYI